MAKVKKTLKPAQWPCRTCHKSAVHGSIQCSKCKNWVHSKPLCSKLPNIRSYNPASYICPHCQQQGTEHRAEEIFVKEEANKAEYDFDDGDAPYHPTNPISSFKAEHNEDSDGFEEKINFGYSSDNQPAPATSCKNSKDYVAIFGLKKCSVKLVDFSVKFPHSSFSVVGSEEMKKLAEILATPGLKPLKSSLNASHIENPVKVLPGSQRLGKKRGKFECCQCKNYSTDNKALLREHINTHLPKDQRTYKCERAGCRYSSTQKRGLICHLALVHGEEKYLNYCDHCDYSTCSKAVLKVHIIARHFRDGYFKCRLSGCGYKTTDKSKFNVHVKTPHLRRKIFVCPYEGCSFSQTSRQIFIRHCANIHGETKHLRSCPCCDYKTLSSYDLRKHINTHLPQSKKDFQCSQANCTYSAAQEGHLIAHLAKQHGQTEHLKKCPHCDYVTVRSYGLKAHIMKHFPLEKKLFQCTYAGCTYGASIKEGLQRHLAKYHEVTKYLKKCPQCPFTTVDRVPFRIHIQTHRAPGENLYKCNHSGCEFSAARKETMNSHLAKEHGEKKYLKNCPHCSFSSIKTSTLKTHMQTHLPSDQKRHPCSYENCKYRASQRQYLHSHLAQVHGETKYLKLCPHCDYSSSRATNFNVHVDNHRPKDQKSHKCHYVLCSFSTSFKSSLKVHFAKVHKETKELKSCPRCSFKTVLSRSLELHIANHTAKRYLCGYEECRYATSTKTQLDTHLAKVHKEKNKLKKCPQCKYSTVLPSLLKIHMQVHLKTHKCSYADCKYSAAKESYLNQHLGRVHGEAKYLKKCSQCSFATAIDFALKVHIEKHLPDDKKSYQCTYESCRFGTETKKRLIAHAAKIHRKKKGLKTFSV